MGTLMEFLNLVGNTNNFSEINSFHLATLPNKNAFITRTALLNFLNQINEGLKRNKPFFKVTAICTPSCGLILNFLKKNGYILSLKPVLSSRVPGVYEIMFFRQFGLHEVKQKSCTFSLVSTTEKEITVKFKNLFYYRAIAENLIVSNDCGVMFLKDALYLGLGCKFLIKINFY